MKYGDVRLKDDPAMEVIIDKGANDDEEAGVDTAGETVIDEVPVVPTAERVAKWVVESSFPMSRPSFGRGSHLKSFVEGLESRQVGKHDQGS